MYLPETLMLDRLAVVGHRMRRGAGAVLLLQDWGYNYLKRILLTERRVSAAHPFLSAVYRISRRQESDMTLLVMADISYYYQLSFHDRPALVGCPGEEVANRCRFPM